MRGCLDGEGMARGRNNRVQQGAFDMADLLTTLTVTTGPQCLCADMSKRTTLHIEICIPYCVSILSHKAVKYTQKQQRLAKSKMLQRNK